jgi:hypothetical protein
MNLNNLTTKELLKCVRSRNYVNYIRYYSEAEESDLDLVEVNLRGSFVTVKHSDCKAILSTRPHVSGKKKLSSLDS